MIPSFDLTVVRTQSDASRATVPATSPPPRRAISSPRPVSRSSNSLAPSSPANPTPMLEAPSSSSSFFLTPANAKERAFEAARRGDVVGLEQALGSLPPGSINKLRDSEGASLLVNVAELARKPVEALNFLIERGADLNAVDRWNESALLKIATRGPDFLVSLTILLEARIEGQPKADPNHANHKGRTVVEETLRSWRHGPESALRALIKQHVNINQPGQNGIVPLFTVARLCSRPAPVVKLLLDAYADDKRRRVDVDRPSNLPATRELKSVPFGTPLVAMARYSADPIASMVLLIRAGANVNKARETVHKVAIQGHSIRDFDRMHDVIDLADARAKDPGEVLPTSGGSTAARARRVTLTEPPNDCESRDIWFAAENGREDLANFYLRHRPETIGQPQQGFGQAVKRYPLAIAAHSNHRGVVQAIVDNLPDLRRSSNDPHFDIDVTDESGMTPLMYAIESDAQRIVHILLKKGADPTLQGPAMPKKFKLFSETKHYANVLEYAIAKDRAQCVKLILVWNKERDVPAFNIDNVRESVGKHGSHEVRMIVEGFIKASYLTAPRPSAAARANRLHKNHY